MNFNVLRFDSIDSTNSEALRHARLNAEEGLCIVARQQTAGRGRQGRMWISPKDAGLFLSVVLRPKLEARLLPLITLASAISVYDALAGLWLAPDIKWPNDILVKEKKTCGILAETAETDRGLAVVVGIGINLNSDSFPSELANTATSLEAELGRAVSSSDIEEPLLKSFDLWYGRLCEPDGDQVIVSEWARRSTYFQGKKVRAALSSGNVTGVTEGLEPNGALRIRAEDGTLTIVQAGDVEQLRTATNSHIDL
jgi:BirA family biotin operon repressor/biotin-[acetyl-CoA-carboxylase] ligase